MLPLIAILLPMLLIFLGFAVDLAYMQTTRMAGVAAIMFASGVVLHVGSAQQAGTRRIDLQRHDLSVPGREVIQTIVELDPGGQVRDEPGPHDHVAGQVPDIAVAGAADAVNRENRARACYSARQGDARDACQRLMVVFGMAVAGCIPVVQVWQLRAEDRRLQPVEPFAVADFVVLVLARSPLIAGLCGFVGKGRVVGADFAALAITNARDALRAVTR